MLRPIDINHPFIYLTLFLLSGLPLIAGQDIQWTPDDQMLNPSGVQGYGSARIDVGDIDGDGWLDLVVWDILGLRMYQNLGTHGFAFQRRKQWEINIEPDPGMMEIPTLADINGDNRADLIIPNRNSHTLQLWLNKNQSGVLWTRSDSLLRGITCTHFVEFSDIDNDNKLDAITACDKNLCVYRNISHGIQPEWHLNSLDLGISLSGPPLIQVRFSDGNSDGLSDLFVSRDWD